MITDTVGAPTEEDVIDALCEDVLSTRFAQALQAQWSDRSVQIPFRVPGVVYGEEEPTPDAYPCIEFLSIMVEKERDSAQGTIEISMQITVNGDSAEVMRRELQRYIAAARRYFEGRSLIPFAGGSRVQVGRTDYGPITARQGKPDFLKIGSIALFVETVV
jgi:hypothetical protein